MFLTESYKKRLLELAGIVQEELNIISPQQAVDKNLFGPVYHGTTPENLEKISKQGFEVFVGDKGSENIRHGYPEQSYHDDVPPPVHHLGYGIYFTTNKAIAKAFNQGTMKGLKTFYLDIPRLETINFGSQKNMMAWWIENEYDPNLAKIDRIQATKNLTNSLKSKYDAVWFKGKGFKAKLLDGDQIVVFDKNRIYQINPSLSGEMEVGSKVVLVKDIIGTKYNYSTETGQGASEKFIEVPVGTSGIIKKKTPTAPMIDKWNQFDIEVKWPHWAEGSEYVYVVTFKKGGTHYNILNSMLSPYKIESPELVTEGEQENFKVQKIANPSKKEYYDILLKEIGNIVGDPFMKIVTPTGKIVAVITKNIDEYEYSFDIAVKKLYRGRGLSHLAMNAVIKDFLEEKKKYPELILKTEVVNERLLKTLADKYGFDTWETEDTAYASHSNPKPIDENLTKNKIRNYTKEQIEKLF